MKGLELGSWEGGDEKSARGRERQAGCHFDVLHPEREAKPGRGFCVFPSCQTLREIQSTTLSCPPGGCLSRSLTPPHTPYCTQCTSPVCSQATPGHIQTRLTSVHSHTATGTKPSLSLLFRPGTNLGVGWVRATDSLTPEVPQQSGLSSKPLWHVWGPVLPGAVHLRLITIPSEITQEREKFPGKPVWPLQGRPAQGTLADSPALAAGLPDGSG